jgi:hypothetical protein
MTTENRVSNEKKNLNRLAGEFLIASRLTQRGYTMPPLHDDGYSYSFGRRVYAKCCSDFAKHSPSIGPAEKFFKFPYFYW